MKPYVIIILLYCFGVVSYAQTTDSTYFSKDVVIQAQDFHGMGKGVWKYEKSYEVGSRHYLIKKKVTQLEDDKYSHLPERHWDYSCNEFGVLFSENNFEQEYPLNTIKKEIDVVAQTMKEKLIQLIKMDKDF